MHTTSQTPATLPPHYGAVVREAVGVLPDVDTLHRTLNELEENGFRREEISVLAPEGEVRAQLNMEHPELRDIMDNPATPRAVFIPQEVLRETMAALVGVPFYIGAGAGAILAIADGQGWGGVILGMGIVGLIGAGLGAIAGYALRQWWQGNIRRQLDKGGLVLWVNISRPQQEGRAWKILSRNHARFVHVHDIPTA